MEIWSLIVGLSVIVAIIASIVQILDFLKKNHRRKQKSDHAKGKESYTDSLVNNDRKEYLKTIIDEYNKWRMVYAPRSIRVVKDRDVTIRHEMNVLLKGSSTTTREVVHAEDLIKMIKQYRKIVLLGEPGSGKTTILQNVAYEQAKTSLLNQDQAIPILVRLGDYTTGEDFQDFLINSIAQKVCDFSNNINEFLHLGRLWLLLDGLDELPSRDYNERVKRIIEFTNKYGNNVIIISCRNNEYHDTFDFSTLLLLPLGVGQIKKFIFNYVPEHSDDLLREISEAEIVEFASNPYILRMLTLVYQERGQVIKQRDELIEKFVDVLIERERARADESGIDINRIPVMLAHLALGMTMMGYTGKSVSWEWCQSQIPSKLGCDNGHLKNKHYPLLEVAINASLLTTSLKEKQVRFYHRILHDYFLSDRFFSNIPLYELLLQRYENIDNSISIGDRDILLHGCRRAEEIYSGQKRYSGDPYLYHVFATSLLASESLGKINSDVVIAALLHDTIELSNVKLKDLAIEFGEYVATLITECYQLGNYLRISESVEAEQIIESLLKSFDRQSILVKLCDRLNNMQTIEFLKRQKQVKIMEETRVIYVPLAKKAGFPFLADKLEEAIKARLS